MSSIEREAALKALRDAEAALAAAERAVDVPDAEVSTAADESVVAPAAVAEAPPVDDAHVASGSSLFSDPTKTKPVEKAKYLDLGPEYLGPVAINGT